MQRVIELADESHREMLEFRLKDQLDTLRRFTYGKHIVMSLAKIGIKDDAGAQTSPVAGSVNENNTSPNGPGAVAAQAAAQMGGAPMVGAPGSPSNLSGLPAPGSPSALGAM